MANKPFAIITYATVTGDCNYRVISQNGDRVFFERLATPRPAPKITLKSSWRTQQQQPFLEKGVNSICKQRATWESRAGVREDTKHVTSMEIAAGNSMRTVSTVDVGTHLSEQEVITDAFSNNEANAQGIERVKIGSNKICVREDLATDKMVFSKESRRAVFELGSVGLIELKKVLIECPSCPHHVFEGTLICRCGKLMRPNQDVMNQMKEAFEILKAPYYRTSMTVTRGSKCGPNPWQQHHHKARDALRSAAKGDSGFTSIWDRWQSDAACKQSQLVHNWSDAWVRNLDHIVHFEREKDM